MPHGIIIPKKFTPNNDDQYFEILSKAVFQVGFNWRVVERKWGAILKAFHGFKVSRVSRMTDQDVDGVLKNPEIIRNGRKILSVIKNAEVFLDIRREYGSVKRFLRSIRSKPYAERRKQLAKLFHGIGPTGVFVFLYTVNEPVPNWHRRND